MGYDVADGYVVLFGGQRDCPNLNCSSVGTGWEFGLNDTWTLENGVWTNITAQEAVAPPARYGAMMTYDPQVGGMILFGGVAGPTVTTDDSTCVTQPGGPAVPSWCGDPTYYNDTWEFRGGRWTELTPSLSPPARSNGQFAYDAADGGAFLFGGVANAGFAGSEVPTFFGDTWVFENDRWTNRTAVSAETPAARAFGSMASDAANDSLLLFGGESGYALGIGTVLNDTWSYQAGNWTQLTLGLTSAPSPRFDAEATPSPDGGVVLYGGLSWGTSLHLGGRPLNDTWEFRAGEWRDLTPDLGAAGPGAIYEGAMATDPAPNETVLFGGNATYSGCEFPWESCPSGASLGTWRLASPLPNGTAGPSLPTLSFLGNLTGKVPYSRTISLSVEGGTPPYSVLAWNASGGGDSAANYEIHPCWSFGESAPPPGCLDPLRNGSLVGNPDLIVRNWSGVPAILGTVNFTTGGSTGFSDIVDDALGFGGVAVTSGWASGPIVAEVDYSLDNNTTAAVGNVTGPLPLTFDLAGAAYGGLPPYVATFDFGDGNSSTYSPFEGPMFTQVVHLYATPGQFAVTVKIRDALGESFSEIVTNVTVLMGHRSAPGPPGGGNNSGVASAVGTAAGTGGFAVAAVVSYGRVRGRRRGQEARELVRALGAGSRESELPPPPG